MPQLQTLPATANTDEILDIISQDGAVILSDVLKLAEIEQFRAELDPFIQATEVGRDRFSGTKTTRTGALIARSAKARDMVMNQKIVKCAETFLAPFCERIQLHLTQVINLKPGQGKQGIHRDRWAWGKRLHNLEAQFNTIWAMTDFTQNNGATQVVPGSLDWPDDRKAQPEEICQAVMSAGSVLLYTGGLFHGGGENCSTSDRIGVNLTYTLGWLRQEENQYLSCPPEIAREFSAEMQDMLGYTMGQYAMGYFTPPTGPGEQPECVSPAFAVRQVEPGTLGGEDLLAAVYEK